MNEARADNHKATKTYGHCPQACLLLPPRARVQFRRRRTTSVREMWHSEKVMVDLERVHSESFRFGEEISC